MTTTRRDFCRLLGGGIVVLIATDWTDLLAQQQRRPYPEDPNAYLRIDEKGNVTVFSGKIEMGQGIHTSLAQQAADELGVSLDSIRIVMGDTDLCPWDGGTHGSQSTRFFAPAMRAAAAEARTVLMNLASEKLGSPKDKLIVANGVVTDGKKKVTYAELAQGKEITRLVGEKAVLRTISEQKLVGASPKRMDGRDKVTGRAQYAGDMRLPGMLYARVLRPPAHGATRKSLDTSKAKAMGATVIEDGDLVAVLAPDFEQAGAALKAITAEWDVPSPAFDTESVHDYFEKNGTFKTGYVSHAPIETHSALAEWKDGKLTAWIGTQGPFQARDRIAQELGLDAKQVRVITPFVGGGFGGKSPAQQGVEAAKLAKITGKPVMVMWTRAEEFFFDTYGPASVHRINATVDDGGKITSWEHDMWASGQRSAAPPYDIPGAKVTPHQVQHAFRTGPWRAPGAGPNVFARESTIDIMAAKAKIDPLEFRLRNTKDERARKVLETAAKAFGWKAGAGPSGQGRAIAVSQDAGTFCALVAQVDVDRKTGEIKVKRIVAAQDMGQVINPMGAKMQMEGCIAMGLGYVLMEELQFKGGEIVDHNFETYALPRFSHVPKIETILIKNDELSPQGGGEPAIVPMGAVVANAFFDLTGVRMYRLPMTPKRVLAALA
jgi:isoquinoline 1-oxidoreductase